MFRILCSALLLTLAIQCPAMAGVPDPWMSKVDPVIVSTPESPDTFHVEVRNVSNAPRANRMVTIDFSAANVRLMTTQGPGITLNCATRTMTALTDANGRLKLLVRFGGFDNEANVVVLENGVVLRRIPARSSDLDALEGYASMNDLSILSTLFLAHSPGHPEADLDASGGAVDLADLTILARAVLSPQKSSYCP